MTIGDVSTKITNLTTTDTNTYPNSDRLIDINLWGQKIVSMILDSEDETYYDDPNFTGYPKVTTPLSTNRDIYINPTQTDSGGKTYSILKLKTLSVSYDGTNYHRAVPLDLAELSGIGDAPASATTQNQTIDANFSKTSPRYSVKNGAIWLYPMASSSDVASGAKMISEWERGMAEFTLSDLTTGTAIPGFDISFHAMLAYGPSFEFCQSKGMPQTDKISEELAKYEIRLRRQYSSKQQDRQYQLSSDYQSMK